MDTIEDPGIDFNIQIREDREREEYEHQVQ